MKKNLTELVFILDRSGSMAGLEKDTIGGFNAMIEKQKAEEGEAYISTVLFDNYSEVIHDRVALNAVPKLTEKEYYVRGCTALLDAVGGAIHHIGNVHKYAREEDRPEKTLFVITTDGMENASRHYTYDRLKAMIQRQKEKYGWEFIFLGANIDALQEAARFGISADRAANYNCDGQVVISGSVNAVNAACVRCKEAGARRALPLPVGGAFHSPLMEPAAAELAEGIENTLFKVPVCPVYQNVTAKATSDAEEIKANLLAQLTSPVRWTQSIRSMIQDGGDHFIELGPGKVLQGLIAKIAETDVTIEGYQEL